MEEPLPESITKLDAARRQLREAIRMFFEQRDAVSIHTLTAAAHGILRDLLLKRGDGSLLKDNPMLRPERKKEFIGHVNRAQRFFKHADRDPGGQIEFRPETTRFLLLDGLLMYQKLTGRLLREGVIFLLWFRMEYPDLLNSEGQPALVMLLDRARRLGGHRVDPALFRQMVQWTDEIPNLD